MRTWLTVPSSRVRLGKPGSMRAICSLTAAMTSWGFSR